jgi:hypothetical protein
MQDFRAALQDVNRVLCAAADRMGSVGRALSWVRGEPLEEPGGLTPMQALEKGRVKSLLDLIEAMPQGGHDGDACEQV